MLLLTSALVHGADGPDYAYSWPIAAEGNSAAYQIELTPEIYAVLTTPDLRDLDVINADGDSVPTSPYRRYEKVARTQPQSPPMFPIPATTTPALTTDDSIHLHIERDPDGKLRSLDAHIRPGSPAAATVMHGVWIAAVPTTMLSAGYESAAKIVIDTSGIDEPLLQLMVAWMHNDSASVRFSVSVSEDFQTWRTIVPDATFVQLRRDGRELNRNYVSLDGARHKYLMLTRLDGANVSSLNISVITPMSPLQPIEHWVTAISDGVDTAPPQKNSNGASFRYHLDAPLSISAANLQLADDNSVAHARLWGHGMPSAGGGWGDSLGTIDAFRLHDGDTLLTNDVKRGFASGRSREWSVELDTPTRHAPTLELGYVPDRVVFLAQGARPYRLVAGSSTSRHGGAPVEYALSQLRASAGGDWQPPLAALGTRGDFHGESALAPPPSTTPRSWRTWMLWAVLVLGATIIAGLALSLLRKQ
jgi:hypothetical protein